MRQYSKDCDVELSAQRIFVAFSGESRCEKTLPTHTGTHETAVIAETFHRNSSDSMKGKSNVLVPRSVGEESAKIDPAYTSRVTTSQVIMTVCQRLTSTATMMSSVRMSEVKVMPTTCTNLVVGVIMVIMIITTTTTKTITTKIIIINIILLF